MSLIFASQNHHKLEEVRAFLGPAYAVRSLAEVGWDREIPETQDSLRGNALLKARAVFGVLGQDCFADDTGLEIEALDGRPGVFTARFAGPDATARDNRAKTLRLMENQQNRRATFRTVIALILAGREYVFEGEVRGAITTAEHGEQGFGYDPIFRPEGGRATYAEMSLEQRARESHRARALARLREFLARNVALTTEDVR